MNYSAQPIWNQQQQHATFKVTPITFPPKINAWFELDHAYIFHVPSCGMSHHDSHSFK